MLTFQSLLLAAVCLCSRAAPLETPERPGDDKDSSLLKDRTRTHSFSNSSLLSSQNPKTTQTSAAPAQNEGDEEGAVGIHEGRVTADGNERRTYGHTTESLPWSSADTLQLGASDEDSRLRADALTSGDSTGPRLLDTADTWTEPVHLRAEGVSVLPSSPEVGTDATMSSEDLPLIFEPFEDVTPPSRVSVTTATAAVRAGDTEQTMSMDTEHTSSDVRLSGTLDWQTSGVRASVTESEQNDDVTRSSVTHQALTVVLVPASEDLESKEEPEEDEEDSDEEEEESEEDLMESTMAPHTRPPYSLIPPPPVWVQRNQGLVRSWVELIREKAGYVSGMLAPVGIGIAGALLLVGALYSIRLIHRKRRDSFKHQRRKPPREVWSGPDNAMLLADSSEDEF